MPTRLTPTRREQRREDAEASTRWSQSLVGQAGPGPTHLPPRPSCRRRRTPRTCRSQRCDRGGRGGGATEVHVGRRKLHLVPLADLSHLDAAVEGSVAFGLCTQDRGLCGC